MSYPRYTMTPVFRRPTFVALLLALALSACGSGEEAPPVSQTIGASQSAAVALMLLQKQGTANPATSRPAAVLGVYVASFMANGPATYGTALKSAKIQAGLQAPAPTTAEVYLVLQQLGAALQVDVPDLLNRSANRRATLDAYVKTLQEAIVGSERQVQALEQRGETLDATHDEQRKKTNAIQRELNAALKQKDYATAARKQEELRPAETEQSATEVLQDEVSNLIDIYDDLLGLAAERLDAIAKNREVLIAGNKVVDVPGIEDLGVLERSRRRKLGL